MLTKLEIDRLSPHYTEECRKQSRLQFTDNGWRDFLINFMYLGWKNRNLDTVRYDLSLELRENFKNAD